MATPTIAGSGNRCDLELLANLIESGKVVPVIDRKFPLHEAPEAILHVEEGHT